MKLERLRWVLLPVAVVAFFVMVLRGATPGRFALTSFCALGWYALSRRKAASLDRDRFAGGKPGRRPQD